VKKAADVEFHGVVKRYGTVAAVDDVSFRIEPGTLATPALASAADRAAARRRAERRAERRRERGG